MPPDRDVYPARCSRIPYDGYAGHRTYRSGCLCMHGAKAFEVMLAYKTLCRFIHPVDIQIVSHQHGISGAHRIRYMFVVYLIAVCLYGLRMSGMEIVGHRKCLSDPDVRRELGIQGIREALRGYGAAGIEHRRVTQGMYARVGTGCSDDSCRLTGKSVYRLVQVFFYSVRLASLSGESVIFRSVICHGKEDTPTHSTLSSIFLRLRPGPYSHSP